MGRVWATTGGRWRCGRRPGRSSRTTGAGCPGRSRPWRRCRGSGRTRLGPSPRPAFGVPVAPLDVNVRRVVSRVLGVPASSPGLQAAADDLVSRAEPGRWFDAVMDLASGTCLPRAPLCDACPLAVVCASRGAVSVASSRKGGAVPFPATTRWLRGRLVAAATAAPGGAWVPLPDQLGVHDREAIRAAAIGLEREGFVELRDDRAARPPLTRVGDRHVRPTRRLRFAGDARIRPSPDPRHRPAAARRRSGHLRDGPARPAPALGGPRRAARDLGRDDDRRGPARAGAGHPGPPAHGARRERPSRPRSRRSPRTSVAGAPARSSSCAAPATTAATATWRPAAWPSPAPRSSSRSSPRTAAPPARMRPRTGIASPATPASSRSTPRSPATSRCSGSASTRRRSSSMRSSAPASAALSASPSAKPSRSSGAPALPASRSSPSTRPTAVDLSSGEPSDPAVVADLTVTFHRPKTGLLTRRGARYAGKVLVAPIGIPTEADRG